ncbi:MAG: amidohydrolase [Leucobacter sp.]|nr:amidohydrolase [Leucobacter sp.]
MLNKDDQGKSVQIFQAARELSDELIRIRRELHECPELGLDLPRTQARVLAELQGLPLEITLGRNSSSVTAVMRGTGVPSGRGEAEAVLLRADMDALPVEEGTGLPFASKAPGRMHACGHDLHVAMLIGAARLLSERRDQLGGDVVFMFQPGEEGHNGAGKMIEEGVLDAAGPRVRAAYAMHVFSHQPYGRFATIPGVIMSASDGLLVTIRGRGGHGAEPHNTRDPITALAAMVSALQTMVTRQFDIFDPVIVTVGKIRAGEQRNVIPDTAVLEATIRSFSSQSRERLRRVIPQVLEGIAAAHGLEVDVDYREEYPVTINASEETDFVEDTVRTLFGADRFFQLQKPMNGSEDFSHVLNEVPGCIVALGSAPAGTNPREQPMNHSPRAVFDEGVLPDGAALYAALALRRLEGGSSRGHHEEDSHLGAILEARLLSRS